MKLNILILFIYMRILKDSDHEMGGPQKVQKSRSIGWESRACFICFSKLFEVEDMKLNILGFINKKNEELYHKFMTHGASNK